MAGPAGQSPPSQMITPAGLLALATAATCYGGLWPVTRIAVQFLSPFWYAVARLSLGALILFTLLAILGQLRRPRKPDIPIILSTGVVMIGIYACLFQVALQYIDAGRAALLGYTMPIWVTPVAILLLGEKATVRKILGVVSAIAGLAVLFNPAEFDWHDPDALFGNALSLLAALIWAPVVIHIRYHRGTLTTLQLVPWHLSVAALVVAIGGLVFEGLPRFVWTTDALLVTAYGALFGTTIAMFAMTTAFRMLPTVTSSVGMLAAPLLALVISVLFLDEPFTWSLAAGLVLILGGIAMVSIPDRRAKPTEHKHTE